MREPAVVVHRLAGVSRAIREAEEFVERVGPTSVCALVTGPGGTGKELIARLLHACSRSEGPFVVVRMAAGASRPAELVGRDDSDLRAALVSAKGGTLFVDGVGDASPSSQLLLVRAIETDSDVRIIAATDHSLRAEVTSRRFREDLYYRLRAVELWMPPLFERPEDIGPITEELLRRHAVARGLQDIEVEAGAVAALLSYDWPGNVLELDGVLARALILGGGSQIRLSDLPPEITRIVPRQRVLDLRSAVRAFERHYASTLVQQVGGDKRAAARLLGICLASLYRKLGAPDLDLVDDTAETARTA